MAFVSKKKNKKQNIILGGTSSRKSEKKDKNKTKQTKMDSLFACSLSRRSLLPKSLEDYT